MFRWRRSCAKLRRQPVTWVLGCAVHRLFFELQRLLEQLASTAELASAAQREGCRHIAQRPDALRQRRRGLTLRRTLGRDLRAVRPLFLQGCRRYVRLSTLPLIMTVFRTSLQALPIIQRAQLSCTGSPAIHCHRQPHGGNIGVDADSCSRQFPHQRTLRHAMMHCRPIVMCAPP